jgi:hypothetical protein
MGVICIVTIFFGATHQWVMALFCFAVFLLLKSELKSEKKSAARWRKNFDFYKYNQQLSQKNNK